MKTYIVSFGYNRYATDDAQLAVACLNMQNVKEKPVDGKYVYTPTDEDEVEVKAVSPDRIRSLTPDERENEELCTAKSSANWNRKENERLRKEVEELKCQLKVALTKGVEA